MRRDIDIGLLRAFVAVVETGSVTGAAALLNLTQAAVSQQLKRLEELFGTALFERHHKRLSLKPSGERLMAHAQRLIALNDEVWGTMSAPAYEGEVRLGVPHDIVGPYLPPILKRFDKAWPRVRVSLECTTTPQLLEQLREGRVDLTLTTEQRCRAGGETLLEDDLVWTGARNGAAHRRDPLPLSLGDSTCEFRASVLKALRDGGRDWRPGLRGEQHGSPVRLHRCGPRHRRIPARHHSALSAGGRRRPAARMPKFLINMYLPPARQTEIAVELAAPYPPGVRHARLRRSAPLDSPSATAAKARPRLRSRAEHGRTAMFGP